MSTEYKIIKPTQQEYPNILKQIHKPPAKLYYKGHLDVLDLTCIAIVGTRKYSEYGEYVTRKIIEELSLYKVAIVSGLAKGIDTIAHKTCLETNTPTIAVLGSGINNIYPQENKKLAEKIQESGLTISEHPDLTAPIKHHFPQRNRVISGISIATLVVEAPEKSGALITARFALEQNREVFTTPGDIDRINSKGPLNLIQRGAAFPVSSGHEIIETLSLQPSLPSIFSPKNKEKTTSALTENEEQILLTLSKTRGLLIDQIYSKIELPLQQLLTTISLLEIKSLIKIRDGKYFRKC
ncbi:DNA-protecting protein DprA [Candidatus Peregrinibacteria bacterium]|nr:DNA-protecting protein DprA [Candidatus Peregrinibacteria bacterium]